jgi:hypothetical protein
MVELETHLCYMQPRDNVQTSEAALAELMEAEATAEVAAMNDVPASKRQR